MHPDTYSAQSDPSPPQNWPVCRPLFQIAQRKFVPK